MLSNVKRCVCMKQYFNIWEMSNILTDLQPKVKGIGYEYR